MTSDLLTVAEVAVALRVATATVRRHISSGDLKAVRVGRMWRIPSSEVDRIRDGR